MSKLNFQTGIDLLAARRAELGLLLLCLFLFFWRLGDARLFDLDEGLYVSSARNMALSGDFVTPRLNSRPHNRPEQRFVPFFEKPVLVYWVSAAAMRGFGISEGAARLPVAAASLAATLLVVWVGTRWFGRRAGLLAGLIYATVPMTVLDARQMTTDALLTLWFFLAMLGYLERRPLLFWAACALAVLTKGVVGLLLPGLVIGSFKLTLWFVARRQQRQLRASDEQAQPQSSTPPELRTRSSQRRQITVHAAGILLFLLIVVPWHIAIWKAGGRDLNDRNWVQEYLVVQHVGRFKGVDKHHNAPLPTYVAYFLIGFFPWACFVPAAMLREPEDGPDIGRDGKLAADNGPNTRPALRIPAALSEPRLVLAPRSALRSFLLCWFWTIFLFFSASAAKLPTYIVPIYPAAALMVGRWLDRQMDLANQGRIAKGLKAGAFAAMITAILLLTAALLLPYFTRTRPVMAPDVAKLTLYLTLAVALGCTVAWLCMLAAQRSIRWLRAGIGTMAATMTLLVALIAGPGYEVSNRWIFGPYQELATLARTDAAIGLPVIYYNFGDRRPSMLFYARDYSPLERKEAPLLPFLRNYLPPGRPAADVITLRSTYEKQLKPELDAAGWVADRLASRDSGLATWDLMRIHPRSAPEPRGRLE